MISKSFSVSTSSKIKRFNKSVTVDSDKSMSIRTFLLGSISQGETKAFNVLESDDVFSCIKCLKQLGVKIVKKKIGSYIIYGKGLGSLYIKKNSTLNFGNSGTLARLLIGILTSTPEIEINLKGDHSLNKRSMYKLINLMSEFGATFFPKNRKTFPLKMFSSEMPVGIKYTSGKSAQLKSAVILAGLNSYGNTQVFEKDRSRDHTENMILKNVNIIKVKNGKKKIIKISGKKYLKALNIQIPSDPSAAAFFVALTIINKNSFLKIKGVGLNPTRTGFYEILKNHGAKVKFKNIKIRNNERTGDITVTSSKLKPIKASKNYYVKATDEYPIMFVIAAMTKGISIFKGIGELTNKESNRIKEMQKILYQAGIKSLLIKNDLKIFGNPVVKNTRTIINVPNLGDHRICMSAMILGLLTGKKTNIKNFETVRTSSPNFLKTIKLLGGKFEIKKKS